MAEASDPMTVIDPSALFHVGIVVDDVERSMEEYTAQAGYHWAKPLDVDIALLRATGEQHSVRGNIVYSLEGPVRLELIGRVDDSPWSVVGLHHLGVWVETLEIGLTKAEDLGWTREWVGADATGAPARFAYMATPAGGARIELVDKALLGPQLASWWAGGEYRR